MPIPPPLFKFSSTDLFQIWLAIESGGGGGGGTATDTNQVIQINELKALSGEGSVFKQSGDLSVFLDENSGQGIFTDFHTLGGVFTTGTGAGVFTDPNTTFSMFADGSTLGSAFNDAANHGVFTDHNTNQSVFWDEVNNTSVFKTALLKSVFIDEISGLSWLEEISTNLDITQTQVVNDLRGIHNNTLSDLFTSLSDIDAYIQGIYSTTNILSTRVIMDNCVSVAFPAQATLAAAVAAVNTFLAGASAWLISDAKYFQNALGTYEAYLTYSNV